MGFKNQFQRMLEFYASGPSFGRPIFIPGKGWSNLAGEMQISSGDMTAEEYANWASENRASFEDTQSQGRALVTEINNLFEQFRVAHSEAVGLAEAVQRLDPATTIQLGNYFMGIINGLSESHNKLWDSYQESLNRKPYTHIEDFQELIPKLRPIVTAMEAFRDKIRASSSDPEKVRELADESKGETTIDKASSMIKWVVIGGIAFIAIKTFLPDIRKLVVKSAQ